MTDRPDPVTEHLREAALGRYPVTLHRRWALGRRHGHVLGLSGEWVALHSLANGVYVDGYELVRVRDVVEVYQHGREYVERTVAELGRAQL